MGSGRGGEEQKVMGERVCVCVRVLERAHTHKHLSVRSEPH